jgi:hypothetical protein
MPNVRRFLAQGVWFEHARCHMPAITDPNHLNAVSGASIAQTGINSVSLQFFDWQEDGQARIVSPNLAMARDDQGRSVDTLFSAWKRKWPGSKTFYVSGKQWVAEMFDTPGSGVDIVMGGSRFPDYVDAPPSGYRFYDPPGDRDADASAESGAQKTFSRVAYEKSPRHFPPDMWLVNAFLKMLNLELPDFGVVLLAQMDDLQHGLGAAWNPEEFEGRDLGGREPVQVSRINAMVHREAVLDGVRDVDRQFGRLMDGLSGLPNYREALVVLYSDHGHVTHRVKETIWDIFVKSAFDSFDRSLDTNLVEILANHGVIQGGEIKFRGFCPVMGSSVGGVFFKGKNLENRLDKARLAKEALMAHRVTNPANGFRECPWQVLDMDDMKAGRPGLCQPGELYHHYYGPNNQPGVLHWPDLFVLADNNWQLPAVMGLLTNVGLKIPKFLADRMAPWNAMIGGHGSHDTQRIVLAFRGPDLAVGEVRTDPDDRQRHRISDIAVTLAAMLGLELNSTTVGRDLTADLTRT